MNPTNPTINPTNPIMVTRQNVGFVELYENYYNKITNPILPREGRQIEYKVTLNNYTNLCKTVVAFSNDIGGSIYIGIMDKELSIIGIEDETLEKYLEEIPKAIYDTITPYCIPEITTELHKDKCILRIQVFPGNRKPYSIKYEGLPKGVYTRIGAHTKRVTEELYLDLIRNGQNKYWDEEISSADINELDATLLQSYYNGSPDNASLLADHVIQLMSPENKFYSTYAGLVYFGQDPTKHLPQCEILYSEFPNKEIEETLKTIDIRGPLPSIINTILATLRDKLLEQEEIINSIRKDTQWIIPELAIREALLNALIHRNYSISSPVKIELFSDRLEIFSPGNFPGPIDNSKLGNGMSYTRNPRIRQLARKAGLVEKRGLGFKLILKACEENNNRSPLVEEGPDFVRVTFYKSRVKQNELPPEFIILKDFRSSNQPIQTKEMMKIMDVSVNTARNYLVKLVELGFMESKGKGRAQKYYWL